MALASLSGLIVSSFVSIVAENCYKMMIFFLSLVFFTLF